MAIRSERFYRQRMKKRQSAQTFGSRRGHVGSRAICKALACCGDDLRKQSGKWGSSHSCPAKRFSLAQLRPHACMARLLCFAALQCFCPALASAWSIALLLTGYIAHCIGVILAPGRLGARRILLMLTAPIYWPLQSLAAGRAIYELAKAPHAWSKTPHALTETQIPSFHPA